jgi:hypothetical protein
LIDIAEGEALRPSIVGDTTLIAALWLFGSGLLIYYDYRIAGVVSALLLATFAMYDWYRLFRRGLTIDFTARTLSGKRIRSGTYLFFGLASILVAALGLTSPLVFRSLADYPIVIASIIAIIFVFVLIAYWTAKKNSDPINMAIMSSLVLCVNEQTSREDCAQLVKILFTVNGEPLNRISVTRRLAWASTMVDQSQLEMSKKLQARQLSKEIIEMIIERK